MAMKKPHHNKNFTDFRSMPTKLRMSANGNGRSNAVVLQDFIYTYCENVYTSTDSGNKRSMKLMLKMKLSQLLPLK